jgi:hypothetical protein
VRLRASADQLMLGAAMVRARLGDGGAIAKLELAIERVRAVTAKLDPLLAQIEALETGIARGEGSLLKLLHDPELPEDMKELGKVLKRQPWKIIQRPAD